MAVIGRRRRLRERGPVPCQRHREDLRELAVEHPLGVVRLVEADDERRRIRGRVAGHVVREVAGRVAAPLGGRIGLQDVHPEHEVTRGHGLAVGPLVRVQVDRVRLAAVGHDRRLADRVAVVDRRPIVLAVRVQRVIQHVHQLVGVRRAADRERVHREDVVRRRVGSLGEVHRPARDLGPASGRGLRQPRSGRRDSRRRGSAAAAAAAPRTAALAAARTARSGEHYD
jgi:hypothetical protein